MDVIDEKFLQRAGFSNTLPIDYFPKAVVLRGGEKATVWVHIY